MKRLLSFITAVIVVACLVAGCAGEVKTYTDSGQTINVGVNQEFVIALGSNPTTGYGWQEGHDETMVELVKSEYEAGEGAEQGMVGAGGIEHFRFKTLRAGQSEVTMAYQRSWEEESLEEKVFTVNVE